MISRTLLHLAVAGIWLICTREASSRPAAKPADLDAELVASRNLEGAQPIEANAAARSALADARRQPNSNLLLRALLQAAHAARVVADYPFTLGALTEGMALAERLHEEGILAELLQIRGTAQWNQANLVDATDSFVESLRIADALGDKALQIEAHSGLGLVCLRGDDEPGALFHFNTALALARELNNTPRVASLLNNLGNQRMEKKDYAQARQDFEQALALSQGSKDQRFYAFLLINLGQIATETGDQPLADRYLDEAMAICQEGKIQRGIADCHYLLASVDRHTGKLDSAVDHLRQSEAIAEKLKNPDLFASIYEESGLTAEARGDLRSALEYERKLAAAREVMRGDKVRRQADEIKARYATESSSRAIKLLQRDKELQQADLAVKNAELRHAQLQRYVFVAFFALSAAAVSALISRLRKGVIRTRRMLAETEVAKQQFEEADALKARLLDAAAVELSDSEARFRTAFQHSALGLALVSPDGRWLSVNSAICAIVGYTEKDLLATTFQAITHPDDLHNDLQEVTRLLAGEVESYHMEKRYFHKDGHIVWVALDVSLVRDSGTREPRYFISQVCDVTASKEARAQLRAAKEEAERANNAKSEFLSRMSHELRTPLNAILGFGQLLGAQDLGRRPNESVGHILTAGRHLLGLINEVLDLAKIESGRLELTCESAHLAGLVVQTLDLVRPLAKEAGVCLAPIATDDGAHAAADPRRLKQILLNLLSNAIKYNHPGGEVAVSWRRAGERIRIEVADTGPGIAPEDSGKIGTPFARLAATEELPGTGLGLSLTKALAEAMGGAFGFRSELGVGSVFWVELDAAEGLANLSTLKLDPVVLGSATPAAEKALILYIEDNLTNLQLVEHLFADHPDIRLMAAMQGRRGLELAREHAPNLILLDLHLPDMTGEAVLRDLIKMPQTAQTPVIVISADAAPARMERLKAMGARRYLSKPFDIQELQTAIDEELAAALV